MKLDKPASADGLPRRDRIIIALLLLLVSGLAWAFTGHQAVLMHEMDAAMWRDMNMSMNGMEPTWTAIRANNGLSTRLPHCMGRVFTHGDCAPMATSGARSSYHHAAVVILLLVRGAFWCSRALPTQPTQGDLPRLLPLTGCFRPDRMARRHPRRCPHGYATWNVLYGLLRGAHAAAVRSRGDGPALGRRVNSSGNKRKASARSKGLAAGNCCFAGGYCHRVCNCWMEVGVVHTFGLTPGPPEIVLPARYI
jgi:hypothetical protein